MLKNDKLIAVLAEPKNNFVTTRVCEEGSELLKLQILDQNL